MYQFLKVIYGDATYTLKKSESCHPHNKNSKVKSKCPEGVFRGGQKHNPEEDADRTEGNGVSHARRCAGMSFVEVMNIIANNPSNHRSANDLAHPQNYGHNFGGFAHYERDGCVMIVKSS
jgi:hypothetical protein